MQNEQRSQTVPFVTVDLSLNWPFYLVEVPGKQGIFHFKKPVIQLEKKV